MEREIFSFQLTWESWFWGEHGDMAATAGLGRVSVADYLQECCRTVSIKCTTVSGSKTEGNKKFNR